MESLAWCFILLWRVFLQPLDLPDGRTALQLAERHVDGVAATRLTTHSRLTLAVVRSCLN